MSHVIRPAEASDVPAITGIVHDAYVGYVARIGRQPGPMLDDYPARVAEGVVHVLESDGQVQGILVLIPQSDALLLDNVAIRPDAQGRGYGGVLMQFTEAHAQAAGLPVIRLYTHVMMTENIAIYLNRGFVETRRVVENGLHRVYMEKTLRRQ